MDRMHDVYIGYNEIPETLIPIRNPLDLNNQQQVLIESPFSSLEKHSRPVIGVHCLRDSRNISRAEANSPSILYKRA